MSLKAKLVGLYGVTALAGAVIATAVIMYQTRTERTTFYTEQKAAHSFPRQSILDYMFDKNEQKWDQLISSGDFLLFAKREVECFPFIILGAGTSVGLLFLLRHWSSLKSRKIE